VEGGDVKTSIERGETGRSWQYLGVCYWTQSHTRGKLSEIRKKRKNVGDEHRGGGGGGC